MCEMSRQLLSIFFKNLFLNSKEIYMYNLCIKIEKLAITRKVNRNHCLFNSVEDTYSASFI